MNEFQTEQNLKKLKETYASLGMETQSMSLKINRLEKLEKILHKQAEDFCSKYMDDTMRQSKETQQVDIIKEVEEMLVPAFPPVLVPSNRSFAKTVTNGDSFKPPQISAAE